MSSLPIAIMSQHKLNNSHRVVLLEKFSYVIKHKQQKANIVVDALLKVYSCSYVGNEAPRL
ncbi:hypothetical protein CR513_33280, partial [Mucuna pruriens]